MDNHIKPHNHGYSLYRLIILDSNDTVGRSPLFVTKPIRPPYQNFERKSADHSATGWEAFPKVTPSNIRLRNRSHVCNDDSITFRGRGGFIENRSNIL
jgi:hypothetical protein